jgi:hypothetical protein
MAKLLFILKRREMTLEEDKTLGSEEKPYFKYCISSGLRNSARFVVDMLNENGIEAKMVEVIDNNCIDREVHNYKPTHVIIEAFWVVPEKFEILTKLHPKVKWIIRNHSEVPFMANEGIAVDWTIRYLQYRDVYIAPNSLRCFEDTKKMVTAAYSHLKAEYKVLYLPNYYKIHQHFAKKKEIRDTLDVGCFGALRPLKNQLVQAIAAVHYAQRNNKRLRFHINVARIEDNGNNVLKNIRGLFNNLDKTRFQLVEHGWLDHKDFLKLISTMDIGLQTSFTETFNIVAADFVSQGVPIVVSSEVEWMPKTFVANHTDSEAIVDKMEDVLYGFYFWKKNKCALSALKDYNKKSVKVWRNEFLSQ